jgi:LysM repeat protein
MPEQNMFRRCPSGSVPYIIRKGDTLLRIAAQYRTSVEKIISANPTINPNALVLGSQICVPLIPQLYPICPTTNYYVVGAGDTIESIASYFNVTSTQLIYSNFGVKPDSLYVDMILCIPVATSPVNLEIKISNRKLIVFRNRAVFKTYNIALENPRIPIPRGRFSVLFKNVEPGVELGARWIGLSTPPLGIQGINSPRFVDVYSTGKSIIMSNKDVSELFNLVPVGTVVRIT